MLGTLFSNGRCPQCRLSLDLTGVNQAGLADCIIDAISSVQRDLQPLLYSNILLAGGSTLFPGFRERLEMELRPLVPDEFEVRIFTSQR
jgi:actin-related protein 6